MSVGVWLLVTLGSLVAAGFIIYYAIKFGYTLGYYDGRQDGELYRQDGSPFNTEEV